MNATAELFVPCRSERRAKKRSPAAPKRLANLSSSFPQHQGGSGFQWMVDPVNMAQPVALREKNFPARSPFGFMAFRGFLPVLKGGICEHMRFNAI